MWTPRDVELMTTAWRYGNTMDEIANDLFQGRFTRAAIAGKISRLGLKRGIRKTKVRVYPVERKPAPKIARFKPKRAKLQPNFLSLPLHVLTPHNCRWPVGVDANGEHLMCGLEADYPYCPYHAAKSIGRVKKAA